MIEEITKSRRAVWATGGPALAWLPQLAWPPKASSLAQCFFIALTMTTSQPSSQMSNFTSSNNASKMQL